MAELNKTYLPDRVEVEASPRLPVRRWGLKATLGVVTAALALIVGGFAFPTLLDESRRDGSRIDAGDDRLTNGAMALQIGGDDEALVASTVDVDLNTLDPSDLVTLRSASTLKPVSALIALGSTTTSSTAAADDEATSTTERSTTTSSTATSSTTATRPSTTATTAPTTTERTTTSTTTSTTAPTTTSTTTGSGGQCFNRDFRDDFNGSSLSDNWLVYVTDGNHSSHAKRRREAVQVTDGRLVITAKNNSEGQLISGGIRHLGNQTYGRYRARVRVDKDPTNSTSGVILTWPSSNNQPRDGENNFYETLRVPGDRSQFYSFIHEPFDDAADGISQKRFIHAANASQWQTINMDWTADHVTVSLVDGNGNLYQSQRLDETGENLITDAEHFLTIQLDQFEPAFPDGRAVRMEVDWVEIWSHCG